MAASSAGYTAYIWYCHRLKAYNNIFWYGKWGAIWWGVNLTDSYFRNNIMGGPWSYRSVSYTPSQHHIDNNLFTVSFSNGANNITNSNPQFAGTPNTANLDPNAFKLKSSSPCINQGSNDANVPALDLFGYERVGGPDIGVHEYGGVVRIPDQYGTAPAEAGLADILTLQVYPSPMTEVAYFSMALLEVTEPVFVSLYDQAGKPVRQLQSALNSVIVSWNGKDRNGRGLKPGVYYYRVTCGEHRFEGRIIKSK
jgi:hypothetical protein